MTENISTNTAAEPRPIVRTVCCFLSRLAIRVAVGCVVHVVTSHL